MKTVPSRFGRLRRLASLWPLLIPALILLPSLGDFSYPASGSGYSDIPVAHYPNAMFLRQAILTYHTIPLWSPAILSGFPFAADPLSGLWYPPGWLALIFPLPLGFNLAVTLHLIWGGLGMYRLLRAEGLSHQASLVGAVGFAAMPKLFAHYGAGHLTLLYAVSWTPWLFASAARERVNGDKSARMDMQAAIILALIFLADPRWVIFAGTAWLVYRLIPTGANSGIQQWMKNVPRRVYSFTGEIILAGLLAAPLALPLFEFARLSTRTDLGSTDVFTLSLPPASLLGLLYPGFKSVHEWILYPGGIILILAIIGMLWAILRWRGRFWLGSIVVCILYALGSYLPPLHWLANVPGIDLLRVPPRVLFLAGMGWAALAAYAVEWSIDGLSAREKRLARLVVTCVAGFVDLLAIGVWASAGTLPLSFAWGAGLATLAAAGVLLQLAGKLKTRVWYGAVLILCLLELGWIDRQTYTARPADEVLSENEAVARYLSAQPKPFRVYSPSYSLPQQTAARYGLELADGVDPLQLSVYVAFMDKATGVPRSGYSVTLPPLEGGNPADANEAYQPDMAQLSLLNIRYVVAEYDLAAAPGAESQLPAPKPSGLELRTQIGRSRVYQNTEALPRVWVQPAESGEQAAAQTAEIVRWSPNEILVNATGPGTLVLSEVAYPGWKARLDGQAAPLKTWSGLLRSVDLGPGLHQVEIEFRPASVYLGLTLWGVGCLWVIWLIKRRNDVNR